MFKYSRRSGTKAHGWGETVGEDEKAARLAELIALQEAIAADKNRSLVGRTVSVLVEGPAKRPAGWCFGRTPQFKPTVFPGPATVGTVVPVPVGETTAHTLIAAAATGALVSTSNG